MSQSSKNTGNAARGTQMEGTARQNSLYQADTFKMPEISLPKGGGAIKGIDEKFGVNKVNGTATVGIPLPMASGRGGSSPGLALTYSSGAGNGPFGLGWGVGIPTIKRKTEGELPRYQDGIESDTFIMSDAEDLVPNLRENQVSGEWEPVTRDTPTHFVKLYRPRIEGLWARIEQWRSKVDGVIHWRAISPDNKTSIYGGDAESRIADPADDKAKIYEWMLSHSYDTNGNITVYKYKREDFAGVPNTIYEKNRNATNCTALYLKKVLYGNKAHYHPGQAIPAESEFMFETVFDFGEHDQDAPGPNDPGIWDARPDSFSFFRAGFDIRIHRLCKRVLLFHKFAELPISPYLVSALELGYDDFPDRTAKPDDPEGFRYLKRVVQVGYLYDPNTASYSSKAIPPVEYFYQAHAWKTEVKDIETENLSQAPQGIDFERYHWMDLYSEGLSGLLTEHNGTLYYKRNLGGGKFGAASPVDPQPSLAGLNSQKLVVQDLEGVGDTYLVSYSPPLQGSFRLTDHEGWKNFQAFQEIPNVDFLHDSNARFIDLNGDGLADLLVSEHEFFEWYESKGEKGFGPANQIRHALDEEQGPRLVFSDPEMTIFTADMCGDGLPDIVRIRNGEVCYWANLGYGRFSGKINMANAPVFDHPEAFNPAYLKLADIDGSGTTDIIYLGKNDFRVWLNLNGNAWPQQARTIEGFPPVDSLADISIVDLLGTGTSCIVWSSPLAGNAQRPWRYIDLMDGKKPHLLYFYKNNLGREVQMDFLPSTYFYLQANSEGRPWATKLPFPVHVVSRVRSEDKIRQTVFTNTYAYHHGYYDGKEREFRGFGRVEQQDTEAFSVFSLNVGMNVVEEEVHQPPVRTLCWYHTGAALDQRRLEAAYEAEYYSNGSFVEHILPPNSLPTGMNDDEWREAMRACKGLLLRKEIYSSDGTAEELHPYAASQATHEVRMVQAKGPNKVAVFQVISQESIAYAYDRNPADPRVTHSMLLETDEKGFATRSASIIYPRAARPPGLPQEVWDEQRKRHIVYAETDYTSDIETADELLIRAAYEGRSYELLGVPGNANAYLSREQISSHILNAVSIPIEDEGDGSLQKRLTTHTRKYFLANDLSGGLPLGQRESLGITFKSYQLAMTPGLVARHYGPKVTPAMLVAAGYEHSEGDADWWVPSSTALYPANAPNFFYLPEGVRDPMGTESHVTFDVYGLLTESTSNMLGHSSTQTNDYRTLAPVLTTDANLNRSAVETDELGMVIKIAVMGKAGLGEGDSLADPTTRREYDFFNWMNNGKPNFVHTFAREEHGAANPRWQESYSYSDGSGGTVMEKHQAEAGMARRWNPVTKMVEEVFSNDRWIGNGRTKIDNKGNPIRQFQPYFSDTFEYEEEADLVEVGVSPTMYYDPLGRNFRTDLPNGTFSQVIADAWHSKAYDVHDTVRDSDWYAALGSPDPNVDPEPANPEQRAAWLTAKHHDTPTTVHTDSLGRVIYTETDWGGGRITTTRTERDATGRYLRIYDQLDREVSVAYGNMMGGEMYGWNAEKGETWMFMDILGRLVRAWDNNTREYFASYDILHRPLGQYVREGGADTLLSYIVYGDSHPNAQNLNLIGMAYQLYDQAGVVTVTGADFKGNPHSVERRLAEEFRQKVNWQPLEGLNDIGLIAAAAEPLLYTDHLGNPEVFSTSSQFDALSRPTETLLPDGTVIRPVYNESNLLNALTAQIRGAGPFIPFLQNQDFNALGQRESVEYGNGTLTRFFYDPKTFRLTNLLTLQNGADPPAQALQNIFYTYDPGGNITQIRDDAQQTHYFANSVVRPEQLFEYDAAYHLVRATGREHAGIGNNSQRNHIDLPFVAQLPHQNNLTAVRNYTQTYFFDDLGNISEFRHRTSDGNGNWTRHYKYAYEDNPADPTNRLVATSQPGDPVGGPYSGTFTYDLHGNMTAMPHLSLLEWDYQDQLKQVDLGGGGTVHYVYGIGKARMRKVIERQGGLVEERIYLGPVEIFRKRQGNAAPHLERWTVSVMGIALVDTKTIDTNNAEPINPLNTPLARYRYANHIGSAALETDDQAAPISYEEYHPFGTSSYRISRPDKDLSLKRYRFSGKERDDETGLDYFGVRYYASWLGRWTSADPGGFVDGFNLYQFTQNNPITNTDSVGYQTGTYTEGNVNLNLSGDNTENAQISLHIDLRNPDTGDQFQYSASGGPDMIRQIHQQLLTNSGFAANLPGDVRESLFSQIESFGNSLGPPESIPLEDGELPIRIGPIQQPEAASPPPRPQRRQQRTRSAPARPQQAPPDTTPQPAAAEPTPSPPVAPPAPEQAPVQAAPPTAEPADDNNDLLRLGANAANYAGAELVINQAVRLADNARKAEIGRIAVQRIGDLIRGGAASTESLTTAARGFYDARNFSRTLSQGRLGPVMRTISRFIDKSDDASRGFEALLAHRMSQAAAKGGTMDDGFRLFAEGVGSGRGSATAAARTLGPVGRGLGAIGGALSLYMLVDDIQNERYDLVIGDAAGVISGGLALAGMGPASLAFGGVAAANAAGDFVERHVTAYTGSRAWGVAAGTGAGMLTGAAFGAAVGSVVPVIGTGVGAAVGAVVGGIVGFIGAFW